MAFFMGDDGATRITGARAMVKSLENEGVGIVFGLPGAMILPFYQALSGSGIRHILTRTEQGAGHAASGYARMAGRPGVCVTTSGPGATNLFTAIATAYSDSVPMIAITGQVATGKLGRDVFQEVDTTGAVEPFTKYAYLLKSAGDIGRVFKEAYHICSTGRKGPVLIDVPIDVQQDYAEYTYPDKVSIRGYKPRYSGNSLQVKRVADAIRAARRPLLCLGGGVLLSGAKQAARELYERLSLPVVTTLMGIGALHKEHPLCFGMLGQNGDGAANHAVARNDLLIIIGARVGDRAINHPDGLSGTTVVHIDIDPAEIGKNVGTTIPLVGDAACVINQLLERDLAGAWPEWLEELEGKRRGDRELYKKRLECAEYDDGDERAECVVPFCNVVRTDRERQTDSVEQSDDAKRDDHTKLSGDAKQVGRSGVDPVCFIRKLSALLPDDVVYIADVGQNQIWSAKNFYSNGRFLTTGGMGTMGYSLPAAIGAQLAYPGRTVVAVLGDGAFQMSFSELATIKALDLPIKIILINNQNLGLVRELQINAGAAPFAVSLSGYPDYGGIAAAYRIDYARADNLSHAVSAAHEMLSRNGAYILECAVDPEEPT